MKNLSCVWLPCMMLTLVGCAGGLGVESENQQSAWDRPGIGSMKPAGGKADESCGPYPNYYHQYLDDTECQKRIPSDRSRDLVCPNAASSPAVEGFDGQLLEYQPASESPEVDENALLGLVPDDMHITVILVRRVDGVPHYRYLSNGSSEGVFQPWSSTKFMAIAQGGARLREISNGLVGLTAKAGSWQIGDLVSIIHNYDERELSSNGLARWFLNVGERWRLNEKVQLWLGRGDEESLGGNYGRPSADVPYQFLDDGFEMSIDGQDGHGPSNQLSTFTLAESLKRLVMARENPELAWPALTWSDIEVLLYGAKDSDLYTQNDAQGMEGDTAIYLQQFDVDIMEERSAGQWRVFSKLGYGHRQGQAEFVHAGYACLPAVDENGEPIPDVGKEFFIATQFKSTGSFHRSDADLAAIYRNLTNQILSGSIK